MDFTYAIIDDVIGVVDDVGDVSGGRRRRRDQRHRKERWQQGHRSGHQRGLRQSRYRPRGRGHRHRKVKDYVIMDIDHKLSVLIDINREDQVTSKKDDQQ